MEERKENIKVPVLLLFFNRLDCTLKVLNAIKLYQPPRIYLACDGPRRENEGEEQLVQEIRNQVLKAIDWNCEVLTRFQETNLGCGPGVSSGITWFFEHEEMGIILEDDCVPNQDFFKFCAGMLVKYKDDEEIMQINGYNEIGQEKTTNKYYNSNHFSIWGWATWANRWFLYDYNMNKWDFFMKNKRRFLKRFNWLEKKIIFYYWKQMKKDLAHNTETTWDTQWFFTIVVNNGKCLQSDVNLIRNIGLDSGTHFSEVVNSSFNPSRYGSLEWPLIKEDELGKDFDKKFGRKYAIRKVKALLNKIKNILFKKPKS